MVYEGHVLLETVTWWDMRQAHSSGRHGQRRRTEGWLNVCLSLMLEAFPDPVAVARIACYGDKILSHQSQTVQVEKQQQQIAYRSRTCVDLG
jgi:hypothetical protein